MTGDESIKGKVAIVTGSSEGIGFAIVEALCRSGARVVVTSRDGEKATAVARRASRHGGEAVGLPFDLEERADLERIVRETVDHYGRLNILVNNALSFSAMTPLVGASYDQVARAINSNVTHTLILTNEAYPHLKAAKGNVINIASVVTERHLVGVPIYGLVKGSIIQMTKVLASEWMSDGIRVNAVSPGMIRTSAFREMGMTSEQVAAAYDRFQQYFPLGIGEPNAIGEVVKLLASDGSRYTTGSVFTVDSGYSVQGVPLTQ